MYYPRVLVVANNSFSLSNSNGRTLGNMFLGWPKKCLAEFCIGSDGANYNVCNNYYCISDREMLTAFIHFRKANGDRLVRDSYESVSTGIRGKKKTAFRATIRHLLWGHNRWFGKELKEWLEDFSPEIVLVQNGDTSFMFTIARKISCYRDIPLIMFNTEGYCLFKHDWMNKDNLSWLFFPIYKQILRNETQKTMRRLTFIIHGNQLLKVDFDREYGVPSIVVYTGSEVKWSTKTFNSDNPSIVYLGNFGYNRPTSLATVARVFRSLDPKLKIDVYGKPRNEDQIRILTHSEGIAFHGAVPYEQVKGIIENADILLHVEGVEDELQESLRYGFSTKIADCLSSGRPFPESGSLSPPSL